MPITIRGIQRAQAANIAMIAAIKPGGAFGELIRFVTAGLHRKAVSITHVWRVRGGGLRASHRMSLEGNGLRGRIYIDPSTVNPRGQRPAVYGPHEHARGGTHAFYERTVNESARSIVRQGVDLFVSRLPRG